VSWFPEGHRRAGDRIVVLVCFVFAGAAMSAIADLPSRSIEFDVLGSPLGVGLSARWIVGALLVGLCVAGVDALVRSAPGLEMVGLTYTATFWILPVLVTLAAFTAVPQQLGQPFQWVTTLFLLSVLLAAVVAAEYGTVALTGGAQRTARLVLNVAVYGAAFALYSSVYALHLRGLLSGPVLAALTFLLAIELLRGTQEQLSLTVLYAAIVALLIGELTIPLNWLGLSSLAGGAALVILLYAFGGVAQQHLAGRLTPRVALEFTGVAAFGMLVVMAASR
jgi:hypothetical protein